MNKIIIIGNLGRDPELRYTPNGQAVTNFSLASNRRYTSNGEQREETEWFNCSVWGRLAEVANQYLTKGQQIYVEGRLRTRNYTTQAGEERFSLDVNVTELQFLSRNGQDQNGGTNGGNGGSNQGANRGASRSDLPSNIPQDDLDSMDADDLPF